MPKLKVVDLVQTCSACPTQYEGELEDGSIFYFRFRGGYGRISIGTDIDEAVDGKNTALEWEAGDWLDGSMSPQEALEKMGEVFDTSDISLYKHEPDEGWPHDYLGRKDGTSTYSYEF